MNLYGRYGRYDEIIEVSNLEQQSEEHESGVGIATEYLLPNLQRQVSQLVTSRLY